MRGDRKVAILVVAMHHIIAETSKHSTDMTAMSIIYNRSVHNDITLWRIADAKQARLATFVMMKIYVATPPQAQKNL